MKDKINNLSEKIEILVQRFDSQKLVLSENREEINRLEQEKINLRAEREETEKELERLNEKLDRLLDENVSTSDFTANYSSEHNH